MRTRQIQGVHRVTWLVLFLLVLALAVFAMATGFSRLRSPVAPEPSAPRHPPSALLVGELALFSDWAGS